MFTYLFSYYVLAVKEISTSSDPLSYFINVDSKTDIKANACLKCVYFPIVKVWRPCLYHHVKIFCCWIYMSLFLYISYVSYIAQIKWHCLSQGKENIERILESLESEGCSTSEKFETYSRVSIRRLGRLLPDARWVGSQFYLNHVLVN